LKLKPFILKIILLILKAVNQIPTKAKQIPAATGQADTCYRPSS
jgi:hypothetical protein